MVSGDVIEEILREHRGDLDGAAKALVRAANRGGGDDNITALLFEIVADGAAPPTEPDERTREYTPTFDEEDTLHPEDGVPVVAHDPEATPSAVDTMVVPAADVQAALAEEEADAPQAGTPEAGIVRRLLALLVILALIALIVVLVWWGLAR